MTISKTDLLAQLKASLTKSYNLLVPDEENTQVLDTIVSNALDALTRLCPVTSVASITLQSNVQVYSAPDDIWDYKETSWGLFQQVQPWDEGFISRLPEVAYENGNIFFSFAPTASMIASLGSKFTYFYYASYALVDDAINVEPRKQPMLLLLCQMEAMKILILRTPAAQVTAKPGIATIQYTSPHLAFKALSEQAQQMAASL